MPLASVFLNRNGEPPFNLVDFLRDFLVGIGVPPGDTAHHLQSLVLFSSRRVLETIDELPARDTYAKALETAIAISKKVMAARWRIALVGDQPFSVMAHPQWADGWTKRRTKWRLKVRAGDARAESWPGKAKS